MQEDDAGEEQGWPLSKTFDLVAVVLGSAVVVRAIGGIVAAAGAPTIHFTPPVISGSGLSIHQSDYVPTVIRLAYGTQWADLITGVLLLGSLGLVVIPRIVWDPSPEEQWLRLVPKLIMGICIVAAVGTVAAVTGIVNIIWHSSYFSTSTETISIAEGISALGLVAITAVLAWFSMDYVEPDVPSLDPTDEVQEADST